MGRLFISVLLLLAVFSTALFSESFAWPAPEKGLVSSADSVLAFSFPSAESVLSSFEGAVSLVESSSGKFSVQVVGGNGFEAVYSGLEELSVQKSQKVSSGSKLGSSKSFSFFARSGGRLVNPLVLLGKTDSFPEAEPEKAGSEAGEVEVGFESPSDSSEHSASSGEKLSENLDSGTVVVGFENYDSIKVDSPQEAEKKMEERRASYELVQEKESPIRTEEDYAQFGPQKTGSYPTVEKASPVMEEEDFEKQEEFKKNPSAPKPESPLPASDAPSPNFVPQKDYDKKFYDYFVSRYSDSLGPEKARQFALLILKNANSVGVDPAVIAATARGEMRMGADQTRSGFKGQNICGVNTFANGRKCETTAGKDPNTKCSVYGVSAYEAANNPDKGFYVCAMAIKKNLDRMNKDGRKDLYGYVRMRIGYNMVHPGEKEAIASNDYNEIMNLDAAKKWSKLFESEAPGGKLEYDS